jgi:hypothetical protein
MKAVTLMTEWIAKATFERNTGFALKKESLEKYQ